MPKSILTIFARLAVCLTVVAITTVACHRVFAVNATTAGFAYLIGVLAIATTWGFLLAAAASVAAMLCFNFYFLPPIGQFSIADPENWVALFTFLATALVASHLSDRAHRQALDALSRQRETEQLYALSRSILLSDPGVSVASQLVQHVAQIFECDAVALFDAHNGEVIRGGPGEIPAIETTLKQAVTLSASTRDEEGGITVAVINLGGRPIGSLALRGGFLSDGALQALVNLVAIALERVRTGEAASLAEVARQSEEFKSTLLDAIAHEFKTPLTSIKAASTSILSDSAGMSPQHKELITIIDEEADRLSLLVTEAVRMSQIDAGKVRLDRKRFDLRPLLETLMEQFAPRAEGRKMTLAVSGRLQQLYADSDLVMLALRQLIENALKYSPEGSPVEIAVGDEPERVTVRVLDQGPGIPIKDRERIFEKYYRTQSAKQNTSGSGLGLYIAREIMRAHGGDLWVESMHGVGSEFCASIPVAGPGDAE